jgi:hypothetical protein
MSFDSGSRGRSQSNHFPNGGRRWYDNVANLGKAIQMTQDLPPQVQQMISRHLIDCIEYFRKTRRGQVNSLGASRVLGLYNAVRRDRWYDPTPMLRRAYTMMATVPDNTLSKFATQVVDVVSLVVYRREQDEEFEGEFNPNTVIPEVSEILNPQSLLVAYEDNSGFRLAQSGGTEWVRDEEPGGQMIFLPQRKRTRRPQP